MNHLIAWVRSNYVIGFLDGALAATVYAMIVVAVVWRRELFRRR
jgi:hypothetical protein